MAVPKRKVSKRTVRQRRAARKITLAPVQACPNCKAARRPHRVCPACGYYRGRQVLTAASG